LTTIIENYLPGHLISVLEIYRPFVEGSAVSFEISMPSADELAERFEKIASKFPFLVLTENNNVLGYAYASAHRERAAYRWCVETTIYMAASARGKGLGKMLYSALLNKLTERNFTLAYGLITLPNAASIKIHESCGFSNMALHKNAGYKLGQWHDVLWMEKTLAPFLTLQPEPIFKPVEK
jgi:phosphinothricin acetyltransferase